MEKKKDKFVYTAQVLTEKTATVNFVSKEIYEELKGQPYAYKLKIIEGV